MRHLLRPTVLLCTSISANTEGMLIWGYADLVAAGLLAGVGDRLPPFVPTRHRLATAAEFSR